MSAASRSAVRRILSALFFAMAVAALLLAYSSAAAAQVYIEDPCKSMEPGSFGWYFHWCWLSAAAPMFRSLFMGAPISMVVQ